uniref:PseudoU_synth_2 domain-containing protein n=1 Tax=Rhabditophanes sp. KR3021 TaxID=114890 RepID=A0AC35TFX2_9BILA
MPANAFVENIRNNSSFTNPSILMASQHSVLVGKALLPRIFTNGKDLSKHLLSNAILHKKDQFLILNKPYGVSCLGYKQSDGGVFKDSKKYDLKSEEEDSLQNEENQHSDDVTIEKAFPFLREQLKERHLTFCTGLKRYVSGPLVLPCSSLDFNKLKESIKFSSVLDNNEFTHHKALVLCLSRPAKEEGIVDGSVCFQTINSHSEYLFNEKKAKKRAIKGKFAIDGFVKYKTLDTNGEISLVELSFSKFTRHLPRIVMAHLGCPLLGDSIYWKRFANIDGRLEEIDTKMAQRLRGQYYFPSNFMKMLSIEENYFATKMPFYFHVHQTVFPRYSNARKMSSNDLVAMSPPPKHFEAMVKLLGFTRAMTDAIESENDAYEDTDGNYISK